jgi:serine/threonine protein kinase
MFDHEHDDEDVFNNKIIKKTIVEFLCDYKLDHKIGQGSEGTVYLACCDNYCDYIIKFYDFSNPDQVITPAFFEKEVQDLLLISELNIGPKIYGAGIFEYEGNDFGIIVMEHFEVTLNVYLNQLSSSNITDKKIYDRLKRDISDIIDILHKHKICHNDLHTDNIMLNYNKQLRLIDFGVPIHQYPQCVEYDKRELELVRIEIDYYYELSQLNEKYNKLRRDLY